ncbi:MAG: penicillin-binding protein 2, partial [Clostridiaceae bacterium]|nr:penicillin-binding protein 2 [Clostridiaceae bacterium]
NARLGQEELNEMLLKLYNVFEKNGDSFNKSLEKYLTFNPLDFGSELKKSEDRISKWISDNGIKIDKSTPVTPEKLFKALCEIYNVDGNYTDEEAYKIITMRYEVRGFTSYEPVLLARDVSVETMAEIEERHHVFKGVTTEVEYLREYKNADLACHVIGYIRGIDAETYAKLKNEGYGINDLIGKSGIELAAEKELRGKPGKMKIEVDIRGRTTKVIEEIPAIPGNNVVLTIDMDFQKIATEVLERRIKEIRELDGSYHYHDASAGAVVAIDVNNGGILAMASYPGYNPSIFLAGPEDKEAQQAIRDLSDPAKAGITSELNRAISGRYAPGSTFKPLVAIAALEEGVIGPQTTILDRGYVYYDDLRFTCMDWRNGYGSHGYITLSRALAVSCNVFFHEVGVMTGIDNIDKWAKLFGLGEKTGIEIPGEEKGIRSNKEYKKQISPYVWGKADTASSSIGQLYHAYTPLQLANYVAAIANGGKKYKPHLIKYITDHNGKLVKETEIEYEQIPLKNETIEAVKAGMIAVANSIDGTAVNIFRDLPYKVGAKTGTAEAYKEGSSNNGVFICYAPAELGKTPEIAVAVVIEHGVYGMYAAPIAREIITEYFNKKSEQNKGIMNSVPGVPVFTP